MDRLRENPCDGAIKLYLTSEALRFRRDHRDLFSQGSYSGLASEGNRARHVVAFARTTENKTLVALTGRFFLKLCNSHGKPIGDTWGDTKLILPKRFEQTNFQDVFTGQSIAAEKHEDGLALPLSQVFSHCPVALLFAENEPRP